MILGIGIDLVSVPRIRKNINQFGTKFCEKILTQSEQTAIPSNPDKAALYVAGRFAAKEAAVKALGSGFNNGIAPDQIEILNLSNGQPHATFLAAAKERAADLGVRRCLISITHEAEVAAAVMVLED